MVVSANADASALLKILAHAAKFPSCAINGVLLGTIGREPGDLHITDVIPIGHSALGLAPAIEIALTLVEAYVSETGGGLQMLGYYHSEARFSAADLTPVGRRIADRLHDKQPSSVVLLLDNKKLGAFCTTPAAVTATSAQARSPAAHEFTVTECPFELFVRDGSKGWRRGSTDGAVLTVGGSSRSWSGLRSEFLAMFKAQQQRDLCDFDEHLDDVSKCFFNVGFPSNLKPRAAVQGQ